LEGHKRVVTEEMKKFLQEGLHNYGPTCLALSEFRRQVRSRLQTVLDEFSTEFTDLGISVADLRPVGMKLDDSGANEKSSGIELKKNHGAEIHSGYYMRGTSMSRKTDRFGWEHGSIPGKYAQVEIACSALLKNNAPKKARRIWNGLQTAPVTYLLMATRICFTTLTNLFEL
jgi:hypothetical protein